jgi:hypothetical protein
MNVRRLFASFAVVATLATTVAVASAAPKATGSVLAKGNKAKKGPKGAKKARVTIESTFDRYLVAPTGKVGGILLGDGSVVAIPHGATVDGSLKKGETIHVEAVAAVHPDGTVYMRPLVTRGKDVIVDASNWEKKDGKDGKGGKKDKPQLSSLTVTGKVARFLLDKKGNHSGAILEDGTVVLAHHQDLVSLGVKKGDSITIEGKGGTYALGKSVFAGTIKLANGTVVDAKPKKPAKK